MIEVIDVWFTYPNGTTALRGISLRIRDGESVAIMGENGAGKTTLVKHFNGLLKPEKGVVLVDGINTKETSVAKLARKVGLVFQNSDHQLFSTTVEDEVKFALKNLGFSSEEIKERVDWVLKFLDLERYRERSPLSLSGGERKRVALASVLCVKPKILVLDEPTIGQDAKQKRKLGELLKKYQEEKNTVIVVTHDVEFASKYFNRIVVMARGKIIADGPPNKVLTNPTILEESSLSPPQVTVLSHEIAKRINNFPKDIVLFDELLNEIIARLRR